MSGKLCRQKRGLALYLFLLSIGLVLIAVSVLSFFLLLLYPFGCSKADYEEVKDLYDNTSVGMSSCEFALMFCKADYKHLRICRYERENDRTSEYWVRTPLRLGAKNWHLLVIIKDDKVVSVKIRSEDSREIKPASAPPDKEEEGLLELSNSEVGSLGITVKLLQQSCCIAGIHT